VVEMGVPPVAVGLLPFRTLILMDALCEKLIYMSGTIYCYNYAG
jgi:hypothetical protein